MRMRRAVCLAFAAVVAWPTNAWAAEPQRVMVLPLRVEGELNPGWVPTLAAGVSEGLERGDFVLVPSASGHCDEAACFVELAAAGPADFLVRSVVVVGEDRTYTVRLQLIAGSSGEVLVEAAEPCELCGFDEVRDLVADESATLRTKIDDLVRGTPVFIVETVPLGARVFIDGEEVGASPLRREVVAGRHIARAEKDGYAPLERDVLAVDGVEERIVLALQPLPERRRNLRPWGWVGLGVGVAGLAARRSSCSMSGPPPERAARG